LTSDAITKTAIPAADGPAPQIDVPETVVKPVSGWGLIDVREVWRFRELLFFFTWRDVVVRYKQTLLGAAWAIIQPVMMMAVFTVFLGRMAKVGSGEMAYPVFVYAGLLPWTFFATAITRAGNSVIASKNIVTMVYFPRLVFPVASVGAAAVDFALAFGVLVVLMFWYGIPPGLSMLLVPFLLVLTALAALAVGTALAALNVAFRDFKYVIPFLVQIWMFATPTVYMDVRADADPAPKPAATLSTAPAETPGAGDADDERPTSVVPAWVKVLLRANPMTGLIAFFRAATLGGVLPWKELGYSTAVVLVAFVGGLLYFRRVEVTFADII